jgi:hypothetical protein
MNSICGKVNRRGRPLVAAVAIAMIIGLATSVKLHAQALGWEGETGAFVTPLAYTASSETHKINPVVAYHYFDAGPVIGRFQEASIEVGIGKRSEFGYTHQFHGFGENTQLSPLWQNGFEIFNGKVNLLPENYKKVSWLPAISTGFIVRTDVRDVGNYMAEVHSPKMSGKTNGDIYIVGSKTIPVKNAGPFAAFILSGGVRGTNAELWGLGGNAPDWQARAFGTAGFAFNGPGKSTIILASEVAQQPHHPYYFDGSVSGTPPLNIPTTLTYDLRVVPTRKAKLSLDFGIGQFAGQVYGSGPNAINIKARHQAGFQVSYSF